MKKVNYRKANREIQKILKYLKSIENVWNEQYNLKLYDAFFQCNEIVEKELKKTQDQGYDIEMDANDEFYYFCEDSYDIFLEDLNELGIEDYRKYIARTSSFYFSDFKDKYTYSVNRWESKIDIQALLYDICDIVLTVSESKVFPVISENCTYTDCIEQDRKDLQYLISGKALQDIESYFHDIIKEYEIITDFKKDQVENFTDYVCHKIVMNKASIDYAKEWEKQEKEEFYVNTACYTFA